MNLHYKRIAIILTSLLSVFSVIAYQPISQFQDSKFGLFIHWGLYSKAAGEWNGHKTQGGEHFMLYERIPLKEYSLIADDFNPVGFNANEWVKKAKDAGMRYIIYTTKHHDGFAMYDSKCSNYNIVARTPFACDPLSQLAEACRKEGIKLGLYYSLGRDWEDPDVPTDWPEKAGRSNTWDYPDEDGKQLPRYIERKVKPQLRELLSNYGEIAYMWFDTPELVTKDQSAELRELIHELQPGCLINSRIGNGMGDYSIIEQRLSDNIRVDPWEACLTMGKNWGFNKYDTIYKSPDMLIRSLTDIVSKGGNMLLNVGPDQKGYFPVQSKPIFEAIGTWLDRNGEAIYGSNPWRTYGENLSKAESDNVETESFHDAEYDGTPKMIIPDIRYTTRNNYIYAIVRNVSSKSFILSSFSPLTDKIRSITLLESGRVVDWTMTDEGLKISLSNDRQGEDSIYVLKIEIGS